VREIYSVSVRFYGSGLPQRLRPPWVVLFAQDLFVREVRVWPRGGLLRRIHQRHRQRFGCSFVIGFGFRLRRGRHGAQVDLDKRREGDVGVLAPVSAAFLVLVLVIIELRPGTDQIGDVGQTRRRWAQNFLSFVID
jgi:hypothetical protein